MFKPSLQVETNRYCSQEELGEAGAHLLEGFERRKEIEETLELKGLD